VKSNSFGFGRNAEFRLAWTRWIDLDSNTSKIRTMSSEVTDGSKTQVDRMLPWSYVVRPYVVDKVRSLPSF
jgi:hypothetical protein